MNEPTRYTFKAQEVLDRSGNVISVGVIHLTHPLGSYVAYPDYARLQAEVERLRKAGDVMRYLMECQNEDAYVGEKDEFTEAIKAWNAAKEGKQ